MNEKPKILLPLLLMVALAATRWPGLLPPNFSAVYALVFCAGVYLPRRLAWWAPLLTIVLSDVALNLYYYLWLDIPAFKWTQLINYAVYLGVIWLGTAFRPTSSFFKLLGGGLLASVLFYLVTNTASWFFNPFGIPEYTRDLAGWIIALTRGASGWPATWELFRNTLVSGGLFTGLFVAAMKLSQPAASAESAREKNPPEPEEIPEETAPETGAQETHA